MRALVLSGGGSRGAFQAGAIIHLLRDLQTSYDAFCGVSVGALNAAYLAQWPTGGEVEAADGLARLWHSISTASVRRSRWPFGVIGGLWSSSFYSSKPLAELVGRHLNGHDIATSGKRLRVGAVNMRTGGYGLFNEHDPEVELAVLASSAFPAMLEPVMISGEPWSDGGLRDVTPLKAAIKLGADQIDVVMCQPRTLAPKEMVGRNAVGFAQRSIDVLMAEVVENDLQICRWINRSIAAGFPTQKRQVQVRVLRPEDGFPFGPLDFPPEELAKAVERGQNRAADEGAWEVL